MVNQDSFRRELDRISKSHSYQAGFNGRLAKYRIQHIMKHLSAVLRRDQALEIGAGEGQITPSLLKEFQRVTTLEPARTYFEELSRLYGNERTLELHNLCFEEFSTTNRFDAIFATGVLEHVVDPGAFLVKAKSLLQDGVLFLTVPNATALHRRIGKSLGLLSSLDQLSPLDHSVGHMRYYDQNSLRKDLDQAGFRQITINGILLKPFANDQMMSLSEEYCDALYEVGNEIPAYCAEIFACAK